MKKVGGKPTINLGIARSHQFAGQLVGIQLSLANLLALLVSAASVIAGATTLAVQQFPSTSAWLIWIAAGGIGTGLALLIEGLTLSALIRVRVASRTIRKIEEKLGERREGQLARLTLPDPAVDNYPLLRKHYQEACKLIEHDYRRSCRQQTRVARRDRRSSQLLALGGCISSMCAGGLFYHSILAGLGPIASLVLSGIFTLAVTGTFVSSEVFKDLQSQAIRENFANGDLAESAMRQGTRMQSLWAVHDQVATYLQSPEARQAIAEGSKLLVTSILEEIRQDLRHQDTKPGQAPSSSTLDSPRSLPQILATASKSPSEQSQSESVPKGINEATLQSPGGTGPSYSQPSAGLSSSTIGTSDGQQCHIPDDGRVMEATGYEVPEGEPVKGSNGLAAPPLLDQAIALAGIQAQDRMEPEPGQAEQKATDISIIHLDMIERAILHALEQASPEVRTELFQLAQTQPLETITQIVRQRYPGYASYLTRQRVAHVMAVALQSLQTQPDVALPSGESQQRPHSPAGQTTAFLPTIDREGDEVCEPDQATGSRFDTGIDRATDSSVQGAYASLIVSRATASQQRRANSSESNDSSELATNKIRPFPVARAIQKVTHHSPESGHRQRIKAAMEQAQKERRVPNYQEIARAAGVGYSTVKKYAPGIRKELQASPDQEQERE